MVNKETKIEVLDELRDVLVRDLQPEKHFAFLRSKFVLDEDDCEEISSKTTRRKKAELFIDILRTRGEAGFDLFCESFIACGKTQLHLLNQILDSFEDKLYNNEVETRPQQELVNMEMFNEHLPRPGESGAPCLPGQNPAYFSMLNEEQTLMSGDTPPPPYSVY